MKHEIMFGLIASIILFPSLGYVYGDYVTDSINQLKLDCINGYIQFTYIDLQSGTLSEIEKIGFANFWFEKCMDLEFDLTTGEFMDKVNNYLEERGLQSFSTVSKN